MAAHEKIFSRFGQVIHLMGQVQRHALDIGPENYEELWFGYDQPLFAPLIAELRMSLIALATSFASIFPKAETQEKVELTTLVAELLLNIRLESLVDDYLYLLVQKIDELLETELGELEGYESEEFESEEFLGQSELLLRVQNQPSFLELWLRSVIQLENSDAENFVLILNMLRYNYVAELWALDLMDEVIEQLSDYDDKTAAVLFIVSIWSSWELISDEVMEHYLNLIQPTLENLVDGMVQSLNEILEQVLEETSELAEMSVLLGMSPESVLLVDTDDTSSGFRMFELIHKLAELMSYDEVTPRSLDRIRKFFNHMTHLGFIFSPQELRELFHLWSQSWNDLHKINRNYIFKELLRQLAAVCKTDRDPGDKATAVASVLSIVAAHNQKSKFLNSTLRKLVKMNGISEILEHVSDQLWQRFYDAVSSMADAEIQCALEMLSNSRIMSRGSKIKVSHPNGDGSEGLQSEVYLPN